MIQASKEFSSRGLNVHTVASKQSFVEDIKQHSAIQNLQGKAEITVVNIHKFSEESNVVAQKDYDLNVQRIYFLDEVHRSYNPEGSFLANLTNSDKNAIIIGLTGTPLLGKRIETTERSLLDGKKRYSTEVFGDYIHKYYYNASIADGYTLRLIREGIETNYKMQLEMVLREIEVLKGDFTKSEVYAHHKFVEPMLEYIIKDFERSRFTMADSSIGAMVVCDSSEQAREMFKIFNEQYGQTNAIAEDLPLAAEEVVSYQSKQVEKNKVKTAALILSNSDTRDKQKEQIEDFKEGKIDLLIVYQMLLTGFDAKRLKKLYLGRVVKDHNLLQTLTRVNRPYKAFRYGYVVDFADIRKEFDATNKAYFDELQNELGDEMKFYSNLFKSSEEIEKEISDIKEKLFHFDTNNAEIFSQQISQIEDRKTVLELKKALENIKILYNLIRLYGHEDLLQKVDFKKLGILYNEVAHHLDLLNKKEAIQNDSNSTNLLNIALEDVLFLFRKVSEDELILADQLKNTLRRTREALAGNFDQGDAQFVSLYDELKRLFDKKNLDEITQEDMINNIASLQQIYDKVTELNRKNNLLKAKYENDAKYARIHKRLIEKGGISERESALYEALQATKQDTDEHILMNKNVLDNESYFEQMLNNFIINNFVKKNSIKLDVSTTTYINKCVSKEYLNEFNGRTI